MALPNLGRTPLPKPGKIRYGVSPTGPGAPAGFDRTCRAGFVVVASERTAMAFQRLAPPDPGPLTQPGGRALRIALLCPRGPLYRHRGGIWKKTMRYAPLTLTTLASLIPPEINAEVSLLDEGVDEIDPGAICADLVGITVITGTAPRAYELAKEFRRRQIPVVLGGVHPTLVPEEAARHADSVVVGYAEESWPQLLRDFAAGRMQRRYDQSPALKLDGLPFPRRDLYKS